MSALVKYFDDAYLDLLESAEDQITAIGSLAMQLETTIDSLDRTLNHASYAKLRRLLRTIRIRYGYQTEFAPAYPPKVNVEIPDRLVDFIVKERAEISGVVLTDIQLDKLTKLVRRYVPPKPGKLSNAIDSVERMRRENRHVAVAVRFGPAQSINEEVRLSQKWFFLAVSSVGKELDLAVPGFQVPTEVQKLLFGITTDRPMPNVQEKSRLLAQLVAHG